MSKNIRKSYKNIVISSLLPTMLMLVGCDQAGTVKVDSKVEKSPAKIKSQSELIIAIAGQDQQRVAAIKPTNAEIKFIKDNNDDAVDVQFQGLQNHESKVVFVPYAEAGNADVDWNFSHSNNLGLTFDIANPKQSSVHLYISVKDKNGKAQHRSVAVSANSSKRYLLELSGPDLEIETGIRSNPYSWLDDYQPIIWRHGDKQIDLANVTSIEFKVVGVPENKHLIFKNIKTVTPSETDKNYLIGLVDEFGQNAKVNFINKVNSTSELIAISNKEQDHLTLNNFGDRSKFNGWKNGPKLEATGFYRVDKYQDKWTLVDPEGYLFYSNGIANIRMANTSTITGYDFDQQQIVQRQPGDLTPEDSIGLNRAPKEAWPSRHVSSVLRANMFTWLPSYQSDLGQHFGYRREVHTGTIDRGETYSFYQANLARKYQTDNLALAEKKWRETTIKRMQSWGFTSFGNWVDPSFYEMKQYPYFANGWIIGDFKTVSSGNDYWSPLPDPFDPEFKLRAQETVKQVSIEVKNSPWCVGVFIDNEKSWGQMGSVTSQYGVPLSALKMRSTDSPSKSHFSQLMKEKYNTIKAINKAWNTNLESWEEFDAGVSIADFNDAVIDDLSTMLYEFGLEYFKVVDQAMESYMPNHLYLGVRFADWGMTPELRKAAAEVVDVVSYNYYKEVINDDFWEFLAQVDMPSIIGEFHNGAVDSGLLNPGLIHAESQTDRGKKYEEYVNSAIDNPYFVGTHWFQYIDSPLTGRALDGENYNVGFVSVTDIPYEPLVNAAKKVNKAIYQRRFGDGQAENK